MVMERCDSRLVVSNEIYKTIARQCSCRPRFVTPIASICNTDSHTLWKDLHAESITDRVSVLHPQSIYTVVDRSHPHGGQSQFFGIRRNGFGAQQVTVQLFRWVLDTAEVFRQEGSTDLSQQPLVERLGVEYAQRAGFDKDTGVHDALCDVRWKMEGGSSHVV